MSNSYHALSLAPLGQYWIWCFYFYYFLKLNKVLYNKVEKC
jgi:hypothetical protein